MIVQKGDIVEVAELRVFGPTIWRGGIVVDLGPNKICIQLFKGDFGGGQNQKWLPLEERWRLWR